MSTKFGNDKCITSQIIQKLIFLFSYLKKMLQLHLQSCSCSSSTFINQFKMSDYLHIPGLVIINEFISTSIQFAAAAATAAAAAVMQLQGCSCSGSILLNQFRKSNNPCVQNLVIIGKKSKTIFDFWLMLEKPGFQFSLAKVWESWAILWTECGWRWH